MSSGPDHAIPGISVAREGGEGVSLDADHGISGISPSPSDGPLMTLGEHLEELRLRLAKSLALLVVVLLFWMVFHDALVEFVTRPHFRAQEMLGVPKPQQKLLAQSYGAPIMAVVKLAFILSLFVCSPWIGYQAWAFVAAGLHRHEKRHVARFAPASFLLFTAGCAFGYFVLIPYALYGLSSMIQLDVLSPSYSFSDYLDLLITLTLVLGGIFQVPLVMLLLTKLGLVAPRSWGAWRRGAVVANAVLAAVVTPGDLFTMLLVVAPLLMLYEAGAWAARWAGGQRGIA